MFFFMQLFNVCGCQKTVSSIDYYGMSNVFVHVNVGTKNHNFNIPLILYKNNIMIAMQKLKFMQEFSFAINVE